MKKTEITKNQIITSTIKLLRQNGNATIKEISDDANVNIAAINYHFTDKQTLMSVVMRRTMAEFKTNIDLFLNSAPQTQAEVSQTIMQFLDDFYQFCFTNMGIIKYILIPSNKSLLEICNKYFLSTFAIDSEFTYKILSRMSSYHKDLSPDDLKVRYMLLFSSLAFPIVFHLDLRDTSNDKELFPLQDASIKEKYVEQLTKLVLS